MSSLISIITPNYNSAFFIRETIASVLSQTYMNWEWLIIDDGSTDSSFQTIREFQIDESRIKTYDRDRFPKGPSACRNIGLQNAKGRFIVFLDSDDRLSVTCLENRIKWSKKFNNLDFGIFGMIYFRSEISDMEYRTNEVPDDKKLIDSFLYGEAPWQTMCLLWDRNFLLKIGGWDETLLRITDPEIHARALMTRNANYKVFREADPDCYYRIVENNSKRNNRWLVESIEGKMHFFKKMHKIIGQSDATQKAKVEYSNNLKHGIRKFIKEWLLSRIKLVKSQAKDFYDWLDTNNIFSSSEMTIIQMLSYFWLYDYAMVRILRIRGILTRLF